jgi:hypothetical protein
LLGHTLGFLLLGREVLALFNGHDDFRPLPTEPLLVQMLDELA